MTTANRIDPRGSGFYLTFDSPSDFLATLGGRENPCTAIFHPRDFPTNRVDPSGLEDYPPTAEGERLQAYYERLENRVIFAYETRPGSVNKFAEKLGRAVDKLKALGSPNVNLLIDHLSLKPLPDFMKNFQAYGFTDPISDKVGVCDGQTVDSMTAILNHESMHLHQSRSFRAVQGILGHWLGYRKNLRALELPVYTGELPFLDKWLVKEPSNLVVSQRRNWIIEDRLVQLNRP